MDNTQINLRGRDGSIVTIQREYIVRESHVVASLVDNVVPPSSGECIEIDVDVSGSTLAEIAQFCNSSTLHLESDTIDSVCDLMYAANFLDMPSVLSIAARELFRRLKGKDIDEVMQTFGLPKLPQTKLLSLSLPRSLDWILSISSSESGWR